MKSWIRSRYWFGWYWASICSMHMANNDPNCGLCGAGHWVRPGNHQRLFGKHRYVLDSIEHGFAKWRSEK